MSQKTCALCSVTSPDIVSRMARWRDPLPGRVFDTIDRCADREACRRRVEANGERWPVEDAGEHEAVRV